MTDPAGTDPERASQRRQLTTVIALIAVGAGGVVLTSSRQWLRLDATRLPPFGPVSLGISGRTEFPALNGLAVVALVTAVLILVTGGWARRVLGALLVVTGLGSFWYGLRGLNTPSRSRLSELLKDRLSQTTGAIGAFRHPVWPVLTMVLAAVLVLAGITVLIRGAAWKAGLSSRYAAPAEGAESGDPWRRLDRGEDPTMPDR